MITRSPTAPQSGGRTIQDDASGVLWSFDNIGDESLAIIQVQDMNLLAWQEIRGLHQRLIDGEATFVLELGPGDPGVMDL